MIYGLSRPPSILFGLPPLLAAGCVRVSVVVSARCGGEGGGNEGGGGRGKVLRFASSSLRT